MRQLDGITNSMDMNLSKLQDDDVQGSLAYCSPWGRKDSDMTERLNCLIGTRSHISKMALVTDQIFSILGALRQLSGRGTEKEMHG